MGGMDAMGERREGEGKEIIEGSGIVKEKGRRRTGE